MKKIFYTMIFIISISVGFNVQAIEQLYIHSSYGGCELQIVGKTVKTVSRESICTLGSGGNFCFTKIGKDVLRSYKGAKIDYYTEWVAINDSINEWFFGIGKMKQKALLVGNILIKGHNARLVCSGTFRGISGEAMSDILQKWIRDSKNPKEGE